MQRYWSRTTGRKAGRTARPPSRWRVQLRSEALEDRTVPSWAGTPPDLITPPTNAVPVTLDNQGDATGGGVVENYEENYYSFVAHATGTYQFTASRTANSLIDTVLGVFDAAGRLLASNDDITPGTNQNSRVSLTLQAGARYYFGITNYSGAEAGGYTWGVDGPARAGGGDDAFEENDSMNGAANLGVLTAPRTVTGLVMADSQDWFRFNTTGAGTAESYVAIRF